MNVIGSKKISYEEYIFLTELVNGADATRAHRTAFGSAGSGATAVTNKLLKVLEVESLTDMVSKILVKKLTYNFETRLIESTEGTGSASNLY